MIKQEYINRLQKTIRKHLPSAEEKVFLFGSSTRSDTFHDVDIAFLDCTKKETLSAIQEEIENSTFPYLVDIVDLQKTTDDFSQFVLSSEEKIWI